jgi:CBS domain-containing protein
MTLAAKSLFSLTASDLMSRDLVVFHQDLPLREAVERFRNTGVHGAPVVDDDGRCVGVLSVTDLLRRRLWPIASSEPSARACSYQKKVQSADGRELIACTLPLGACPAQRVHAGPAGKESPICALPHCIFTDWQVVELDDLPTERVRQTMTADPVTVTAERPINELARMMIDASIHRIIVINDERRPIGVVSSTDLLAVLSVPEQSVTD